MPGGWLCPEHLAALPQGQKTNQQAASQPHIVLDRNELMGLKAEGLIPLRGYIYCALRIDGLTRQIKPLKMFDFCQRWGLTETDVIAAIANLGKKGIVKIKVNVEAQAITHDDRIKEMEIAARG
ncbi:MAG: hypothetical protein ACRC62_18155 [Microcoleus sp.]